MTLRDDAWDAVIKQLVQTGQFRISDLPFDEPQHHTVRRVLREMEALGWLRRTSKRAATWRLGEQAELHLNIPANNIRDARR